MYCVRMMRREDIAQVAEIDREAFPTIWPPVNYQRELSNRLARYIVICDEGKTVEAPAARAEPGRGFSRLVARVRGLFNHDRFFGDEARNREYTAGFAGFWMMAGEAHITNIAVRESCRRQGIGELLLTVVINLAIELKAQVLTLEVRASNTAARNLYQKYGFTEVGRRRGYYTDNREDGVVMSTGELTSAPFQARLRQLKQLHSQRWGMTRYRVAL